MPAGGSVRNRQAPAGAAGARSVTRDARKPESDASERPATHAVSSGSAALAPTHNRNQAPPLGVIETKLIPPRLRPGTVTRDELLDRLTCARASPFVGVFAPAGYGKTTLLAQFVARDERRVAWVSVDERDNDPVVLLSHVGAIHLSQVARPGSLINGRAPGWPGRGNVRLSRENAGY
jgi:hypothetical protein